ncbi:hypothetical protein NLT11_001810 [Cronobacter sakazakii]|jgi:hypothetical protein|uniref:hypothetical protein n=1 Tax=Enterobacterales TaxID=91347 RepID=UPI00104229C6|nr:MULTISPECIES: hypothetical protein [Enterobacterales]EKU7611431.1 hypothetical protein [Citrobacter freundii]EKU9557260.1 hypothetical protein [Enterobacter roggenkampii MGH 34]EKV5415594.1 hypothetical protein [Enterobacter hormaechei]EKY1504313.1 hypothetical protein [Enterobacter cloacae]HDY8289281.1 hypothetical protein [Klebsiella pneumoniae]HED3821954.1 hypothetical protein [Enterobacter hormaechei subsp. oharae]HEG2118797.1 hypothetical protein [Enterobacter kobei]
MLGKLYRLNCQSGVWQGNEISTVYPGFIDYGSHVEMFGTIYGIGDDSCVNSGFPVLVSQVLSLTGSVSDLSSLANAGVTSAYFTVINGSQFRVCVKNKDSSRSNNIAWRALAIK